MGLLLNIYLGTLTQRKQEENEKFRISIATKVTNFLSACSHTCPTKKLVEPERDDSADQKVVESQGVQQAPVRKVLVAARKGRKKNVGKILMGRIEDLFRQQTPAIEGRDQVNCKRKELEGVEVLSMVGTKRVKRE